jgi:hypothetical protein
MLWLGGRIYPPQGERRSIFSIHIETIFTKTFEINFLTIWWRQFEENMDFNNFDGDNLKKTILMMDLTFNNFDDTFRRKNFLMMKTIWYYSFKQKMMKKLETIIMNMVNNAYMILYILF